METQNKNGNNWRTILSLGLSGLGILFFLIQSFSLGALWFVNYIDPQTEISRTISIGLLLWASIFLGLILVPVFLLSFYQLKGQEPPKWLDTRRPILKKISTWIILLWPLIVGIGWFVAGRPTLSAFLLGAINILVAALPILWIYTLATRDLKRGYPVAQWRIFGFSLIITPVIIIVVEIIALLILAGIGVLYISYRTSINPTFERDLLYLYNQISVRQADVDAVLEIIRPYIFQPSVITWGMIVFAGVVPVIEEIIKPLALWSLAGRKISPQEGFVGGLLCGAGFALIENVLYFSATITAMDWLFVALGRAGTGVLHMLASGLVGWGLAKAWRDGKWVFLIGTSISAIVLHGLWNAVSLATGVATLVSLDSEAATWQDLLYSAPTFVLLLISVVGLAWIKRYFSKQNHIDKSDNGDIEALETGEVN
jgi:hypothetical protein